MAFGAGAHDLEFKKNHIAAYVFEGFAVVDVEEEIVTPETNVTVPEEPAEDDKNSDKKNNKNNKNKKNK